MLCLPELLCALILPLVPAFVNNQKKTGFESQLGHARKLPLTLRYAVIFTGYFNFLNHLQMTINKIPTSKPPSPFFHAYLSML